jgi:Fe2+ or Zn2+ uptake regulation protein
MKDGKMPKKNQRKTASHIMTFLEQNKGEGFRFTDVYKALREKGYHHNFTSTIDNLRFLVKQGKIVKVLTCYGIPVEKNGNRCLTIKSSGQSVTVNIE